MRASASFSSVTSNRIPCSNDRPAVLVAVSVGAVADPDDPPVGTHHAVVVEIAALAAMNASLWASTRIRSSGCTMRSHMSGSAWYASGVTPRICSICGFTYCRDVAVVGVDDRRDLLDQAPVAGLGLGESRLRFPSGEQLTGIADGHDRPAIAQRASA